MKKFLLPVTIILISVLGFISCKRSDPKIFTPNNPFANQKLRPDRREHFVSPDGKSYTKFVDGKPVPARFTKAQARERWAKFWNTKIIARMDTAYLKHEIDSLYTADTLLKYFGSGVHSFFLKVFVTQQQYIKYSYSPYPQLDPEELVYNIKFDLYNSMLHVGPAWSDWYIFRKAGTEPVGTFVLKDNDCTGSHIFEIIKGVDKNRKITHPTTIRDAEMMQYMPDIDESFYDNKRLWPYCEATGIIGGYEELQSKLAYPEEAKKKGVTGNVLLMVWLDEGGAVRGTQLLKSLGYGCDEAAVKAVRQVKFYKHPQGKKNFWIVPVEFAFQPEKSKCDLTCSEFAFQPDMDYRNNNITYVIKNIGKAEVPTGEYNIVLYIDGVMASATDYNPQYKPGKEGKFYVKSTPGEGEHEYTLYIDPENVLKEENRANNIIKGKFYGKSIDKRNFIQKFFSKY